MRTLHVDTGREMRGGQWQALYLMTELAEAGNAVTLLARPGSPLSERALDAGLNVRPLRWRELLKLAPSFDLVHAHDGRAHTLASLLSQPFVVSRRVAFPAGGSVASRWKYSRPARYLAVSNFVKGILEGAGVPSGNIDVVYDGIRLSAAPHFTERKTVVALDSDDPGKGKSLIVEAGRRSQIEVVFSNNLPADLERAALFVYISESEGLGSAALLAMAAGVPVLASAIGGLPEIVENGVTGFLTANRPEQIADGMLRMMRDEALRERLGRNGRARVEQAFTTGHMMRNTLRVYEKVLA